MRHIDIWLFIEINRRLFPDLPSDLLRHSLKDILDTTASPDTMEFELMEEAKPATKNTVQALHDKGFTQKFISEFLNIKQPNISYHLATKIKHGYVNTAIKKFQDHYGRLEL